MHEQTLAIVVHGVWQILFQGQNPKFESQLGNRTKSYHVFALSIMLKLLQFDEKHGNRWPEKQSPHFILS